MNIRDILTEVLSKCNYINSYKEVLDTKEYTDLASTDKFKSCGYIINPTGISKNGYITYSVEFVLFDKSPRNQEIINGTMESSIEALRFIYKNIDYKYGDMSIKQEIISDSDNDSVGIVLIGTMNVAV